MIAIVFPVITIAFSAELLQGEHCINAIDITNNRKISAMLIPLFRYRILMYPKFAYLLDHINTLWEKNYSLVNAQTHNKYVQ